MNWLKDLLQAIVSVFVAEKLPDLTFKRSVDKDDLAGVVSSLGVEVGMEAMNEALAFVTNYGTTISHMTSSELHYLFNSIYKSKGKFNREASELHIKKLTHCALMARIEHNADKADHLVDRIHDEQDLTVALYEHLSNLARFALAKAIGIASHGVIV